MPAKKKPATTGRKTSTKKVEEAVQLSITIDELTFLRDLMSVMMPPDGQITAAKVLAQLTESEESEESLWLKIFDLCENSGVPVGENAPDYLIAQTMGLSVYQVAKEEA